MCGALTPFWNLKIKNFSIVGCGNFFFHECWKSYNLTSFSSLVLFACGCGVLGADGAGVIGAAAPALFLFLLPGPMLLMLSEPGLLGGESLTTGPMVPLPEPEPTLLKWPVPSVGPWIIDGTGATVIDGDGGGVRRVLRLPRFDVVTTALLDTEVPTDTGNIIGPVAGWLLDVEPRFGFRSFSAFSVDCELQVMQIFI